MTSRPKCSSISELNSLCNEISDKTGKEFDALVKSFNIDKNSNKQWASEYYSLVESNKKLAKKIKVLKVLRWVLIIFLIFPFFLCNNAAKKKQAILDGELKKEREVKDKLDDQLSAFVRSLSYDFMFKKIIEPVWQDIKLNIYQDEYAFSSWFPLLPRMLPEDTCYLELISGSIFDNPFMVYNYKAQTWYMHTYTGSIPCTYTTTDSQGHTVTRTEIVTAAETLPAPQWNIGTELAYHFDKPAKLSFINDSSKKEMKKLNKKNIQSPMENKEFDKLFPATRSDEKDYRVVFTPLAQENFVKLFKEQKYVVGKNEDVTLVNIPGSGPMLDTTHNEAEDYDLEAWRKKYCEWVSNLVHTIGLLSLPIASMPLYTQFETNLKQSGGKGVASWAQVQENITYLFNLYGIWNKFDTDVIFEPTQTKTVSVGGIKFSATTVNCHYFWPDHQTIIKPTMSIHCGLVNVPIHVIYYRPRTKKYIVYQSVNLNNSNLELITDNVVVHRGQVISLSDKAISESVIKRIKNMTETKKKKA